MRLPLAVLLFTVSALAEEASLQRFAFEKAEMGLPFRVTLYAPDEATAKAAAEAAFARVAELNAILSDYDPDSEISKLSHTHEVEVPVSQDLWNVLERGQAMSARSDGAFDVTVGPLVNLWRRARRKKELPSQGMIDETRARVGWKSLQLNPEKHTAKLLKDDMRLDVGSIGKAYAVDAALKVLRDRGIPRALVGGSGDMSAGDPPPGQTGWKIEAAPLDAPDAPKGEIVLLNNSSIATSGDLFQHVEIGGVRYSHIVDPHTGLGLTDHSLVIILAPDCATANSLSTTVSVLGPERGLKLIEDTPVASGRILRKPGDKVEEIHSSRWPSSKSPS
jgi:thiamine biosynthesis lipoprotein